MPPTSQSPARDGARQVISAHLNAEASTEIAATAQAARRPPPFAVFIARTEARARLWQLGEITLHDAVDELQSAAVRDGLVEQLGQDAVQAIMAEAFAAVRDGTLVDRTIHFLKTGQPADMVPDPPPEPRRVERIRIPISTLRAAQFLVLTGDVKRLQAWLAKHGAKERAEIHQHLGRRACR